MMVKSLVTKMTTKQQNLPVENNILTIARCCHLKGQNKAGLLIFRAVADPRNSGISAKFPKKREIPRNPPEIFPNTCRQNIFNTYLGY